MPVGAIDIYIPGFRCSSVLSIVKISKQSLFVIMHFATLTHKIYLLM